MKNNWSSMHPVYIPKGLIKTHKTNITGVLEMTVARLKKIVKDDALISDYVEGVLERNHYFDSLDEQMSPYINKENI